jgi:hypothetical protein
MNTTIDICRSINKNDIHHDISIIIKLINNIYENMNINKAVFIIKNEYFDELYKELDKYDFTVCQMNNPNSFILHNSRIVCLRDQELSVLHRQFSLKQSLIDVNLILFIAVPSMFIEDRDLYNSLGFKSNTYILEI